MDSCDALVDRLQICAANSAAPIAAEAMRQAAWRLTKAQRLTANYQYEPPEVAALLKELRFILNGPEDDAGT